MMREPEAQKFLPPLSGMSVLWSAASLGGPDPELLPPRRDVAGPIGACGIEHVLACALTFVDVAIEHGASQAWERRMTRRRRAMLAGA